MRYKQKPGYTTFKYYWADLDQYTPKPVTGSANLWIAVLQRAYDDLTWNNQFGDYEMRMMQEAYEFITVDNAIFSICCEVMNFAESHIKALREFAEVTFKANYIEPAVKEWKRKGRKPRGYIG